ncbi:hypothetical protein RJ640_007015 [Escallonia rubra]|uniref:Reverse transcriptase Ty1/copia-type domain-containing protein n=1 Tax=Escallonia rubra TaxID=112253 RepID=A0AA88UDZ4_9ASTE|nr:hypothetical protein RJ640_007015 [Escallonia rubra]
MDSPKSDEANFSCKPSTPFSLIIQDFIGTVMLVAVRILRNLEEDPEEDPKEDPEEEGQEEDPVVIELEGPVEDDFGVEHGENRDEDSEFFYSQPTVSPENITMADGPNFLINTKLSGLNNENLDPKSVGLSHDIDRNKNGGTTGTKELLVYSRRKQIQRNETDASQYCQDSVPQTIQNSIEATGDTHTEPIHLNLPISESSQSKSSMSDLDEHVAHRKGIGKDDIAEMERLKQCLASEFEIKNLGSLKFFLGMEIARSRKGIAVSQRKYVLDLLKETGMSGCRPVKTPIDPNQKLGDNKGDPEKDYSLERTNNKILKHTQMQTGQDHRKSTSGYCTFVWGNLVTWRSKKQSVVARSSAEAEYRAMAHGICEMMWLKRVLEELRRPVTMPMKLYCDNKATINIANNPVQHDRTKHVEIDRHFIKEKIEAGTPSLLKFLTAVSVLILRPL